MGWDRRLMLVAMKAQSDYVRQELSKRDEWLDKKRGS